MQRTALNESAGNLALHLARTLAGRDETVLLLHVLREEELRSGPPRVSLDGRRLGVVELHEDHLTLGVQLARAAHVDHLVLVCPDDTFGEHLTGTHAASVALSRVDHEDSRTVALLLALVALAAPFGLHTLWVEVRPDERDGASPQPTPNAETEAAGHSPEEQPR